MINISFDRAYLLLLILPLLAVVIVPFAIAIRKENVSKSVVTAFVLHIVMSVFIVFATAGMSVTAVITETQVYVVADASYSANRNLDEVDGYVRSVKQALPDNSKMGIIAFGRDAKLITPLGGKIVSVKKSGVDDSATDIQGALEYAGGLFDEGVVKRIVLITDGKQTGQGADKLVNTIEMLHRNGVYIDAIYLDDNLEEGAKEIQIDSVDYTQSTYLNKENTARVLLQSASDNANVTVSLYQGENLLERQYPTLSRGYEILNFNLPTDEPGEFHYTVKVFPTAEEEDRTKQNNEFTFTQTVAERMQLLLISGNKTSDLAAAKRMYGDFADVTAYAAKGDVPCTVEQLIVYDEILLSDTDVRDLNNYTTFISSLDTVVSQYGKSLVTFGDSNIQNKTDNALKDLEDMLPVKFGNSDQDPKLLVLVLDTSRSMEAVYRLTMIKQAATQLLHLLNESDFVSIITFSGDVTTVFPSAPIGGELTRVTELINNLKATQGTVLSKGMEKAYETVMNSQIENKQVMLLSDGKTYTNEADDPVSFATKMLEEGVKTSVINPNVVSNGDPEADKAIQLLKDIATAGDGNYYFAKNEDDLQELLLAKIADDVTESVIEGDIPVKVHLALDGVLDGVETLPALSGYVYAKAKASATTVLTTEFKKTSGDTVEAPIYAYWTYGDGRVGTFTSSLSCVWSQSWSSGDGETFFKNVVSENTPTEKNSNPFTVAIEDKNGALRVSVEPSTLNYDTTVVAEISMPNGEVITQNLVFNATGYYYEFAAPQSGKYSVKIIYSYPNRKPEDKTVYYDVSYFAEYDAFAVYNVSDLHKAIRNRGNVYTDGNIKLVNEKGDVATYTIYCTLPFMILSVLLFIADIIIRKLRWADIRNLFGLKEKRKGGKR